jgi:hypothetical protein
VKNAARTPKSPAAKTGLLATLSNLLRPTGSSAPLTSLGTPSPQITKAEQAHLPAGVRPRRRALAATFLAAAALLALTAAPASAAILHPYQSQLTEAGGSPFGLLQGLAVDSAGNLYASDGANHVLDKFDSTGAPVTAWGTNGQLTEANGSPFSKPFGLTVDGSDNLWLADPGLTAVDKFEPSGAFLLQSSGESHLSIYAQSIAFSKASEHLYVADSNADDLWVLKADGSFLEPGGEITGPWGSGCCFIRTAADNTATATGGDLYVSGEGNAVYRIDGTGTAAPFSATAPYIEGARITGTPAGPFGPLASEELQRYVGGVAVDSTGNLYVADPTNHRVDEFDSSGKFLGGLSGTPTGPGGSLVRFGEIAAIGIGASTGELYVADNAHAAIDVFGAPVVVPDATTKPATAITTTSATLNGEVNPVGIELEECAFEYGETEAYGQVAPCAGPDAAEIGNGTEPVAVHADVSSLHTGAVYHFRLIARNENGTNIEGGDQTFLTGATIDSTSASQVTATSATLETELNPHGLPTTYHFEYDTAPYAEGEPPHGTPVPFPDAGAGSGTLDVFRSAQIQGLQPLTTYHYRVVATNSLGTSEGPDRSFTTQGAAASLLPDGRQWEMVSPPNKHGAPLEPLTEEGGVIQAAADGSGLTYVALGPLGPESEGVRSPTNNQWLSKRGPAGFTTRDITTPHEEINIIKAGEPSEYNLFADDLSASVVTPAGYTPLSAQTTERTPYRREADGEYVPLVTAANVPAETKFANEVFFRTATPDLSHTLLVSSQVLAPGFKAGFEPEGRPNVYELSGGSLQLVSVLPSGEAAAEAGLTASVGLGRNGLNMRGMRGAISSDGNRVVFKTETNGTKEHLYLRDVGLGQTVQLDELQLGAAGGPGAATFQAASSDGSKVFFTDASGLTSDSTVKPGQPDLYMCEITVSAGQLSCALSDLSIDHNPGEAANMNGTVSAIDASGSHAYFAASGVLTNSPNSRGEHAVPGDCDEQFRHAEAPCNLYAYDTDAHQISLVAVLSSHDNPDWAVLGNLTARSSPNGRYLTFMSQRSLTGYDNRDAGSGQPDAEVYLYDSGDGALRCVSCNPTGARPDGVRAPTREEYPGLLVDYPDSWGSVAGGTERWLAASIPGWTWQSLESALYQSRYLSDSGRLFFTAADALVPTDTNGVMDVYQYEPPGVGDCTESSPTYGQDSGGCVSLISSGTSPEESAFLDASESGDDVFFLTASKLASTDVDNAFDVYDAHACSVASPCTPPPPPPLPACEGDACQQPANPPGFETPGTSLLNGPANLTECPKGKVKKSGKCVKQKHHKKHHRKKHHKRSHKRAANHNRGGAQ